MKERYVIDTNILIAASASDPKNPRDIDATPSDPAERMKVWEWLNNFLRGSSRLVVDSEGIIEEEYGRKLGFNDFGVQVIIRKMSSGASDFVDVAYDANGHGILPVSLSRWILWFTIVKTERWWLRRLSRTRVLVRAVLHLLGIPTGTTGRLSFPDIMLFLSPLLRIGH